MNGFSTLAVILASTVLPADLPESDVPPRIRPPNGQFTFVRVEYDSSGGYGEAYYSYDGRFWLRWQTDYPEAEQNFLYRVEELTTIKVDPAPIALRLTDPRLLDFPFIYMCDVGWQVLSDPEVRALRSYLERGGFLWVDDFWGDAEWHNFEFNMRKVFPDLRWKNIPSSHPILRVVFPLEQCPQVPAKIFWSIGGASYDNPDAHRYPNGGIEGVQQVNFKGLFDASGQLMAVATHNSDIGDGWEREAEDIDYFNTFSTKSYALGINIIVYALTH